MDNIPLNPNVQINSSNIPSLIQNVTSQFIVKAPSVTLGDGVSGFVFDIISTEEMMIESDITDHFIEDNTSIQDHIALRPERYVLSGYVGELADIFQNSFLSILTTAQSLGTVFGIVPSFSTQATQFYNKIASVASNVGNVINQAKNIYSIFSGNSTTASKQQNAFQYFYNLWTSRILCQIETPYGILNDMAIERIHAKQDEHTRLVSDFSVTFKRIRKASTVTTQLAFGSDVTSLEQRADQIINGSTPVNTGTTAGILETAPLLNQSFDNLNILSGG